MPTVKEFVDLTEELAPKALMEGWDNCGLQVGSLDWEVTGCVLAVDVTKDVIALAESQGANLIVTHHPVIFRPLSSIRGDDRINRLIRGRIASLSAHTNLDRAEGGVNDALFRALELSSPEPFHNEYQLGKLGRLPREMTLSELAAYVKARLGSAMVQCAGIPAGGPGKPLQRVAVASGASGDFITAAKDAGADAFITGEAKHNDFVDAVNLELPLLAAGHHETERVVLGVLLKVFSERFPGVRFSNWEESPVRVY